MLTDGIVNGAAEQASMNEAASLAWLTLKQAATDLGLVKDLAGVYVRPTPVVKEAKQLLESVGELDDRRSKYRG